MYQYRDNTWKKKNTVTNAKKILINSTTQKKKNHQNPPTLDCTTLRERIRNPGNLR